eukprot:2472015-Pyramimonas_sp.AAC.1
MGERDERAQRPEDTRSGDSSCRAPVRCDRAGRQDADEEGRPSLEGLSVSLISDDLRYQFDQSRCVGQLLCIVFLLACAPKGGVWRPSVTRPPRPQCLRQPGGLARQAV